MHYFPILSYPKKSRNRKFQTQKVLRSSQSFEIRSTPPPPPGKIQGCFMTETNRLEPRAKSPGTQSREWREKYSHESHFIRLIHVNMVHVGSFPSEPRVHHGNHGSLHGIHGMILSVQSPFQFPAKETPVSCTACCFVHRRWFPTLLCGIPVSLFWFGKPGCSRLLYLKQNAVLNS